MYFNRFDSATKLSSPREQPADHSSRSKSPTQEVDIRGASEQLERFSWIALRTEYEWKALSNKVLPAPHFSFARALRPARMAPELLSVWGGQFVSTVKRLKNQLQSKKAKGGIGKSWLYGQFSKK